ncbi:Uncharacterized protein FWK35_00004707, partial [Aphis craccivora]
LTPVKPGDIYLFVSESQMLTEGCTLGIKEGVINQLYTRIQFAVSKEQLLSPKEIANPCP